MSKITCNAELCFDLPDGFSKIDHEVVRMTGRSSKDGVEMISDPDRHMTISVGWRPLNLAARLNNVKDLMKSTEAGISKGMQPYGYKFGSCTPLEIDGEKAESFNYDYTAEDIPMHGETIVIKRNKIMYNIHLYARQELLEPSLETWQEILKGIRWV